MGQRLDHAAGIDITDLNCPRHAAGDSELPPVRGDDDRIDGRSWRKAFDLTARRELIQMHRPIYEAHGDPALIGTDGRAAARSQPGVELQDKAGPTQIPDARGDAVRRITVFGIKESARIAEASRAIAGEAKAG